MIPYAGRSRAVPMLFTAAFRALRDRLDGDDPVLIRGILPNHGIERLSVRAAEGQANDAARRGDQAKIFAVRSDYLHSGIRAHIEASSGVKRAAVAVSAALQLRKLVLVGERAIRLDVECRERGPVGDIEVLFVGAEDDAISGEIFAV